jgi:hypothetical protein
MLRKSRRPWLAKIASVAGVPPWQLRFLMPASVRAAFPQTIDCTGVTSHVRFLHDLTETLPAGTLIRVNFHLNLSGYTVTGGVPLTTSGRQRNQFHCDRLHVAADQFGADPLLREGDAQVTGDRLGLRPHRVVNSSSRHR